MVPLNRFMHSKQFHKGINEFVWFFDTKTVANSPQAATRDNFLRIFSGGFCPNKFFSENKLQTPPPKKKKSQKSATNGIFGPQTTVCLFLSNS